ncbi:MAG: IclR family transcriptional regulator, partial [Desulfobacterales bacterium]|nr:IclR family transcriptional regulator [Desulfobacterales bacterium]
RLISTLKDRGYIEKDHETGYYRLGLVFIAITSQYLNNLEIKTEAEPYLRRASEQLGETVFLAILRDDEVVYIDKVERFDSLRRYSIIGQRRPINCTSLGKSLVMDKSPREIRDIFRQKPMKRLTKHTIVDVEKYIDHLKMVKGRGWSNDAEEYEEGVSCVGAPIRDYRGHIIAAISSAWEGDKSSDDVKARGEMLKSAADDISRHLGFFTESK